MQYKRIVVKEVFKSSSADETNKFLKEKIVKLVLRQQKLETNAI